MAAPTIPPRPKRPGHARLPGDSTSEGPQVPPRPSLKRPDHADATNRDSFARSPLNLSSRKSPRSDEEAEHQTVTLPSIGQEGNEYADLKFEQDTRCLENESEPQTRGIASDLPMHAPKPSLPKSSVQAHVATITRTDSLSPGITSPVQSSSSDKINKTAFLDTSISNSSGISRPTSTPNVPSMPRYDRPLSAASTGHGLSHSAEVDEHGIPEIGVQVPMYPNAGDVQAPSPAPFYMGVPSAMASESDLGRRPGAHHGRNHSSQHFGPPGSYGLHAHGRKPADKFEESWYKNHPEEDHGAYGPGLPVNRPDWAMSSEELNKIVRETANRSADSATSPMINGYPNEQIGYLATEEYTSRLASPRSGTPYHEVAHRKTSSNATQHSIHSPLKNENSHVNLPENEETLRAKLQAHSEVDGAHDETVQSETDDDVILIPSPNSKWDKIHGGGGYNGSRDNIGLQTGEEEYSAPILAQDEVAKSTGLEQLHPALSPPRSRRDSGSHHRSRSSSKGSRPTSIHLGHAKSISHDDKSLEDVEEYEPLFPEDEGKEETVVAAAERFKSRPKMKTRFPSQDIWEEAPPSVQHFAEVTTPELPQEEDESSVSISRPETGVERTEASGKGEEIEGIKIAHAPVEKEERPIQPHHPPLHRTDLPIRPNVRHRFPSQDIWEDAPPSQQLVTTVDTPEDEEVKSPPDVAPKPHIPPRPGNNAAMPPSIPSRPPKKVHVPPVDIPSHHFKVSSIDGSVAKASPIEGRKPPAIPDRPKPQIPPRPAKFMTRKSPNSVNHSPVKESEVSKSFTQATAATTKPKVSPPIRHNGGKITALRAGFLSDLDKRLQLGPHGPKIHENTEESTKPDEPAPLRDARKGRARGPSRRKPTMKQPSVEPIKEMPTNVQVYHIAAPWSIWQIGEDGGVIVTSSARELSSEPAQFPTAIPPGLTATPKAAEEPHHDDEPEITIMAPEEEARLKEDVTKKLELDAAPNAFAVVEQPLETVDATLKASTDKDESAPTADVGDEVTDASPHITTQPSEPDDHGLDDNEEDATSTELSSPPPIQSVAPSLNLHDAPTAKATDVLDKDQEEEKVEKEDGDAVEGDIKSQDYEARSTP